MIKELPPGRVPITTKIILEEELEQLYKNIKADNVIKIIFI